MKIYIVDDDPIIVKILEEIVEIKSLGFVIGYAYDGRTAIKEISEYKPDIVLIDYLLPNVDGTRIIEQIRDTYKDTYFIMISQVSDKEMIGASYDAGIEFFINKPINIKEVEKVINSVSDKIKMKKALNDIKALLHMDKSMENGISKERRPNIEYAKDILSKVGVLGEKGSYDVIRIYDYIISNNINSNLNLKEICTHIDEDYKTATQRIRRSLNKGLRNIAYLGLEDYMNEYFTKFSNTLFDFKDIKAEMDYLRGKRHTGGKVNVNKFIENLLILSSKDSV